MRTLLHKYPVSYHQCEVCRSLQTETPYWLEEAYSTAGTGLDVGACQRSFDLALDVSAVLSVLDFSRQNACLDYGAGMGLFARFMRDRGYDFFACDRYRTPFYMDRYLGKLHEGAWSMITAFEVVEHLPNPAEEFAELFRSARDLLICSTEFWTGQGLDWWYLVPDSGQHVFFYSPESFRLLAREHGFSFIDGGRIKLFLRHGAVAERKVASLLPDRKCFERLRTKLLLEHQREPNRWLQQDFARLVGGEISPADGPPTPLWRRLLRGFVA